MDANGDSLIRRQPSAFQKSQTINMDELGQRLSKLRSLSSTPPLASQASQSSGQLSTPVQVSGKKTIRPPHLEEQADSGYVSVAPSPDSQKAEFAGHDLPGTKLKYFNKQVPPRLNARFFDIKVLYSQPLLEAIAKKRRNAGDIGMKLKFLGLSEQSTEPYIVIQCEKKTAKIVRKFFSQPHIEEELRPDFRVLVLDKELMRLADEDTIKVFADGTPLQTWCGMPLTLKRSSGSSVTSTLGGIVMVEEENGERMPYGLTASHALTKLRPTGLPTPDASDSDTDSNGSDAESEASAEASDLSRLELTSSYEATEAKVAVHSPELVGYVAHNSLDDPARASQDWALVRLLNFKPMANTLLKNERSPPTLDLMQNSWTYRPNIDLCWNDEDSADVTSDLDPTAVLVLTRKGEQPATVTFNTSSVLIAPGKELVQTHDLSMRPTMRLQPGDSGSWVVNESTGEVYGYVISIDVFGEAQVMPLGSVMLSIKEKLNAVRVWLPSLGDMSVTVEEAEDMGDIDELVVSPSQRRVCFAGLETVEEIGRQAPSPVRTLSTGGSAPRPSTRDSRRSSSAHDTGDRAKFRDGWDYDEHSRLKSQQYGIDNVYVHSRARRERQYDLAPRASILKNPKDGEYLASKSRKGKDVGRKDRVRDPRVDELDALYDEASQSRRLLRLDEEMRELQRLEERRRLSERFDGRERLRQRHHETPDSRDPPSVWPPEPPYRERILPPRTTRYRRHSDETDRPVVVVESPSSRRSRVYYDSTVPQDPQGHRPYYPPPSRRHEHVRRPTVVYPSEEAPYYTTLEERMYGHHGGDGSYSPPPRPLSVAYPPPSVSFYPGPGAMPDFHGGRYSPPSPPQGNAMGSYTHGYWRKSDSSGSDSGYASQASSHQASPVPSPPQSGDLRSTAKREERKDRVYVMAGRRPDPRDAVSKRKENPYVIEP